MLQNLFRAALPLFFALLSAAYCTAGEAADVRNEWTLPYSADNPPGPAFTESEKQRQFADGQRIRSEIIAACNSGLDSFTIPPGDYRFGANWLPTEGSFVLKGLHRTETQPFRILAHGATFWFNLSDAPAPSAHRMVKIIDCSHLTLEGLIVDSDPRGSMDARITAFDFEGNRIQVEPLKGTRLIQRPPDAEGRFIPFKADGHHVAALYAIDAGWGPGNVFYKSLERTDDGRYWLTMKNEKLLRALRDDTWRKTYGPAGSLEVGDVLGILYSTSESIWLNECRQITIRDCKVYAAKACISESGGYGDHRWLNCRFMARPGSNNLLGGEGTMNNACQHGSTFEGTVVHRSTDDGFNNHGYWKAAASAAGQTITFRHDLPRALAPDEKAEIYDSKTQTFIGTFTVEHIDGKTVSFREPINGDLSAAAVIFPGHQNAGWVIRNCAFVDCYQRVLLHCGPGVFQNNHVIRCGGPLIVSNGPIGHIEGGSPDHVTIRDNLFIDSGISPTSSVLSASSAGRSMKNICIENNLFCNSGREAVVVKRVEGLRLCDNIFINPHLGAAILPATNAGMRPAFRVEDSRDQTISGNLTLNAAAAAKAEAFVRQTTDKHSGSALDVVREFRSRDFRE